MSERYEYSPYGRRTAFSHGWLIADMSHEGAIDATDGAVLNEIFINRPSLPRDDARCRPS